MKRDEAIALCYSMWNACDDVEICVSCQYLVDRVGKICIEPKERVTSINLYVTFGGKRIGCSVHVYVQRRRRR